MDIIIKLNNQSNGRDKLARLAQYTSRLIWHQLENKNANKYSVDRIRNLESTLSSFRKILRLGRCLDVFYTAFHNVHHHEPWLLFSLTLSKVGHALYLYADHVVWLTKSGFLNTDTDKWNRIANKFWLVSIIANLAKDIYEILEILKLHTRSSLLSTPKSIYSVTNFNINVVLSHLSWLFRFHREVVLDTFKDSCDLFIPMTALGLTKFSPSTVGVLGAASSLAALFTLVRNICDAKVL